MSIHALDQLGVGQVPAEEPACGEASVEQQLVWMEGEGGADCTRGLEVVRKYRPALTPVHSPVVGLAQG